MIIKYPIDYQFVIDALKGKMNENKHKGNSWQDSGSDNDEFLMDKLTEEYAEVILDPTNPEELADLANITLMLLWRRLQ